MSEHIVIGVCGGTGSGKTTLAERLYNEFKNDSVLIGMDCYYKDNSSLTYEERCKINYDHPSAFDMELFINHVAALKRGEEIMRPTYDFTVHNRADEWVQIKSKTIIIVEGILLFENKALTDLMDMKIFVDTDADVRILRRIMRDVKKRGRSLDSVVEQYLTTVKPMHEEFVEPYKRRADVIVPEGGHNDVAVWMIIDSIKNKLKGLE